MIFCVEDDTPVREIEVYTLRSAGFATEGFGDGAAMFEALRSCRPELILLDVMLPGEDGVSILKRLKAGSATADIPVIMATAKGAEYDKIVGLDLGADDYLVKPFGMMEMVARVKAVLRRVLPRENENILRCGELTMDLTEHSVHVGSASVQLSLKEYEVLHLMLQHPGMVFTREQLLDKIWGMNYDGETRTVDVHIRTLRQKLGEAGACIETVRGVGYRLGAGK